jgi:hypothetical protein
MDRQIIRLPDIDPAIALASEVPLRRTDVHTLDALGRRKREACHMAAPKDGRQGALPDPDSSIALARTAREEFEGEFLARHPTDDQLIERAKKDRDEFIAGLLRSFAVRLKSLFRASAHPSTSVSFDA